MTQNCYMTSKCHAKLEILGHIVETISEHKVVSCDFTKVGVLW